MNKIISVVLSLLILSYAFSPSWLRIDLIFLNRQESIVILTALSLVACTGVLIYRTCISDFKVSFTLLDGVLSAYFLYLLLQQLFYPMDREVIFKMACLPSAYFLFRQVPTRWVGYLCYALPVLAVVRIIYGYNNLTDCWQSLSDVTGGFDNTGIFGGFVAVGLVAVAGLIYSAKQHRYAVIEWIVLGVLFVPLAIQLLYSQSRAAWLATLAGLVACLLLVFHKITKRNSIILVSALLLAGISIATKLYHFKKDSADGRLLVWTVGWNMLGEKPLTGLGQGGFQANYMFRQGEYLKNHPESPWNDLAGDTIVPFNEFLKIGIEQGIVGLLFVAGILFLSFSGKNRQGLIPIDFANLRIVRGILLSLLIFSCFSYPFNYIEFQLLLVFCLACIAGTKIDWNFVVPKTAGKILVGVTILVCGTGLFSLYSYSQAIFRWNCAMQIFHRDKELSLDPFRQAYPELKQNPLFLVVYGGNLQTTGRYYESLAPLKESMRLRASYHTFMLLGEAYWKTKEYSKAQETFELASYMRPSAFQPQYNLAQLFWEQKDYKRAGQKASEIINKKIKIDHPMIDQIKEEMQILLSTIKE